jgi:hypothetical protein
MIAPSSSSTPPIHAPPPRHQHLAARRRRGLVRPDRVPDRRHPRRLGRDSPTHDRARSIWGSSQPSPPRAGRAASASSPSSAPCGERPQDPSMSSTPSTPRTQRPLVGPDQPRAARILHKDGDTWASSTSTTTTRLSLGRAPRHRPPPCHRRPPDRRDPGRDRPRGRAPSSRPPSPPLVRRHDDDYLLSLGVPAAWLPTLRKVTDADELLAVTEKLPPTSPSASSTSPTASSSPPQPAPPDRPLTDSPDTSSPLLRPTRPTSSSRRLDAPLDRWIAFLHPSQRAPRHRHLQRARQGHRLGRHRQDHRRPPSRPPPREGRASGPAHQLRHHPLRQPLPQPPASSAPTRSARITVSTVHAQALDLARRVEPRLRPAATPRCEALLELAQVRARASIAAFVLAEWSNVVVNPQGLTDWAEYRAAKRTGRGRALSPRDRKALWEVFEASARASSPKASSPIWPRSLPRAASQARRSRAPSTPSSSTRSRTSSPPSSACCARCAHDPGHLLLAATPASASTRRLQPQRPRDRGPRPLALSCGSTTAPPSRSAASPIASSIHEIDDLDGGAETREGARSLLRGPAPDPQGYAIPRQSTPPPSRTSSAGSPPAPPRSPSPSSPAPSASSSRSRGAASRRRIPYQTLR